MLKSMGRGSNHLSVSHASAQQLLFGKTRQGTREVKLSAGERTVAAEQVERAVFEASGGLIRIDQEGTREWLLNGERHREGGPAVEYATGSEVWYVNGRLHREAGPTIERAYGGKEWYKNGQRHREGGPAVEHANGTEVWHKNGQRHREDGPAVEDISGTKEWWKDGQLHRAMS
jgi:hypothetical protein